MILSTKSSFFVVCFWSALASLGSAASANLLSNAGFEDVGGLPLTPGDNITDNLNNPFAIPNWQKTGSFEINLVRVDGPGGTINYGNMGPESDADYSGSGVVKHYLDQVANSNTRIYQTFSLPLCETGTPDPITVDFGAYFSNRLDATWFANLNVSIVPGTNPFATPLTAVNGPSIPPGTSRTYPWTLRSGTASLIRGQTYTFSVQMGDAANVDNTFVTLNPADACPSTNDVQSDVAEYLQARNAMILDHEPDRRRRIRKVKASDGGQSAARPFAAWATQDVMHVATSTGRLDAEGALGNWDIWTEGALARFEDTDGKSGHFGVGYVGVDYQLTSAALIGIMLQMDHLDMDFGRAGDAIAGTGWMVGPYATVHLGEKLFFDIRGAWGESQNKIQTAGVTTGKFKTSRWLASGALIGDFHFGNWTFSPELQAKYISEYQEAFYNDGSLVSAQTISQGDVRFGPRIAYNYITDNGDALTMYLRTDGVYSFADNGAAGISTSSLASSVDDELRARFEAGLNLQTTHGMTVSLSSHYDGIGQNNYEIFGGTLRLTLPLH